MIYPFIALTSGVPTSIAAIKLELNYENYDTKKINGFELKTSDFDHFISELLKLDEAAVNVAVGKNRKFPYF